jgi:hypothetical protein
MEQKFNLIAAQCATFITEVIDLLKIEDCSQPEAAVTFQ